MKSNNNQQYPTGSQNLQSLSAWYGVDKRTLKKWLKNIDGFNLINRDTRTFSPAEVRTIVDHCGQPNQTND